MKKIILGLSLLLSVFAFGQMKVSPEEKPVEIGKIAPMGMFMQSFEYYKSSNKYFFSYKDQKYTTVTEIKGFTFKDEDKAFDNLYKMIMDGFENPPKEDIKIELPNDIIWLHYGKSFGAVYFQFYHSVNKNPEVIGVSQGISKKQVMKLFGKQV